MVKYIVKRILLSIVILLGVSLIIYTLARLMPVDFLEEQFNAQLQAGSITYDQLNQFKKDAGLYKPDAYLYVTVQDSDTECDGLTFVKDVPASSLGWPVSELYTGDFNTEDELWQLRLTRTSDSDGNYSYSYTIFKRQADQTAVQTGSYSAGSDVSLTLNGLNGSLGFEESADEAGVGYLIFKVESGPYADKAFRKEVKTANYDKAKQGKYSVDKLLRGDWDTLDQRLRITLDKKGGFTLYEMKGNASVYMDGVYTVIDELGTVELLGMDETVVESRVATAGEKLGAVLKGYFGWLWNMMRGNLGRSFKYKKPVTQVISEHMWISFIISLIALVLEFVIAIPLGITSATHQYSARDYITTIITMVGISFPSFFFAALLVRMFATDPIKIFESSGLVSGGSSATGFMRFMDMAWHLVLPMTVMVVLSIGSTMRYTRTNMLEVLNSDYIRTARAKGLSEKKVVYVHAFRNTLIPLMTMMAGILPSLFGGAMITEQVFAIDGIGRIAYAALRAGDLPLIMGYNMFLAILTVIGTLLSDLMYAVVDPRVKLTK